MTRPAFAAPNGTYIGLTRGRHEMDRDADRAGVNAPVTVAAENALEAPGNRAGCVNHAGPGASPGAVDLPPGWRLSADGDRLSPREA